MRVLKVSPRGYCYGVVDAMVLARQAADDASLPRPIYILGMIVHNAHVVEAFRELGIQTLDGANRLELLEKISSGTVIFTAHGVSPEVKVKAKARGLHVLDATCPDVTKTHRLIEEKVSAGYDIVYIGRKGHPEPEGAMGVAPHRVHLVENEQDVAELHLWGDKIVVTNQTTMSQWDTQGLIDKIVAKYPQAEVHNEICMATQLRQTAVAEQVAEADLCLVVGDPRSNNSNRLAQVSEEIAHVKAYRIADIGELNLQWLEGIATVAVTSGASTPTAITKEVIEFLERYRPEDGTTVQPSSRVDLNRILPAVRS
ncbi:4-hydroxy-3-methylbut-2-enyl diphosphate reductase [Alicyclobacillus sp. SP_1]|uniref:4-hydroxy-3-methylbut-2-enyl diphosphate reductase n=1 Tax=Alicyclobacillus sp. SP_1 TaxID=2942475 RepID=UPI0021576742|nr:4-hydroxy-3-methylbut-2-enyl diphosphate reductase [Alicyclobacillus sp. SP_1]